MSLFDDVEPVDDKIPASTCYSTGRPGVGKHICRARPRPRQTKPYSLIPGKGWFRSPWWWTKTSQRENHQRWEQLEGHSMTLRISRLFRLDYCCTSPLLCNAGCAKATLRNGVGTARTRHLPNQQLQTPRRFVWTQQLRYERPGNASHGADRPGW